MISLKHFLLRTNTKHSTSHVKHRHTKGAIQEMLSRSCRYGCIALPTVLTSGTLASTWLPLLHFAPAKYDRSWRDLTTLRDAKQNTQKSTFFSSVPCCFRCTWRDASGFIQIWFWSNLKPPSDFQISAPQTFSSSTKLSGSIPKLLSFQCCRVLSDKTFKLRFASFIAHMCTLLINNMSVYYVY